MVPGSGYPAARRGRRAQVIYAVYEPTAETARAFGIFADTGTELTDDAPIAQRLLVLTGRA